MARGGRSQSRLLAVATIAALTALGAGAALAGLALAPLEPEVSRTTIPEDRHLATTARCHGGSEVVSGGFAAPDRAYAGGGPYTEILGAARKGDDGFTVRAQNFSSAKGRLTAFAYCGEIGPTVVATKAESVGALNDGVVTARCPDGLTAVSGGWDGKAPEGGRPQFIPYLSKRARTDGWKVGAENGAFKGSAVLVAQVLCADLSHAPDVAVNDRHMQDLSQLRIGASCDGGHEAIAGGFDAATPRGYSAGAEVYGSRRKSDGQRWKVAVINGGRDRHLRVYAYCA